MTAPTPAPHRSAAAGPARPLADALLPGQKLLAAVIHDVAPETWSRCRILVAALEGLGIAPLSLLVVPHYHGGPRNVAFERWLLQRAALGDELVLHGYDHRDPLTPQGPAQRWLRRVYTAGEGEFAALDHDEALRRLRAGRDWMGSLGVRPAGFVAPAWLMSRGTWEALREQPLRYTCTLREVTLLPQGPSLRCTAQVWSSRSAWRRAASIAWNGALRRLQSDRLLLRLELHPADAGHASTWASWRDVAIAAMGQRRQAVRLEQLADLLADTA
ncbi:polysaccharide deacetylase family protein [Pelomonas sp. APW6]|uniref:Polysaccharide deacetylase family protein n=1 Tax=Roseateles subflavus TaxID=3053353 RepID=A0ABT7LLT8_9BURK|nr:polysaccharide deacetylase family protein [Pelomonas sp. APW6]MDL5033830.1 polysaccharide deacetylase family protein [Pelomonas sp. APW6]